MEVTDIGDKMTKMKLKVVAGAVLAVVAAAPLQVPTANADEVLRADANDNSTYLDIKSVSADHGKGDRLKHTITTFESWSSRKLGNCSKLEVQFPDAKRVITIFRRDGELKARMDNPFVSPSGTIARPKVWRPDGQTVAVSFDRSKLGNVGESYKWRSVTSTPGRRRCPSGDEYGVMLDAAPDRYSFIHRL